MAAGFFLLVFNFLIETFLFSLVRMLVVKGFQIQCFNWLHSYVFSMADNKSKELAFESVALISKALSLLEAGQLGVVSFGEEVQLIHPLHESFNEDSGPR